MANGPAGNVIISSKCTNEKNGFADGEYLQKFPTMLAGKLLVSVANLKKISLCYL